MPAAPATTEPIPVVNMVVHVNGSESCEEEDFSIRCFGSMREFILKDVAAGSTVLVKGALRLQPTYEAQTNKYYFNPVVHVAAATGCVMSLS